MLKRLISSIKTIAIITFSIFYVGLFHNAHVALAAGLKDNATTAEGSPATTRFLIISKGRVADPLQQQQRGIDAVELITKAANTLQPDAIVDSLAERAMTIEQYRRGQASEAVTGAIFRDRLKGLIDTAKAQDTVVIYTHSHGLRNGFEPSQPLGGMGMDLPVKRPIHGGAFLWDEYVDLILSIPAKNIVVFTMACYSGGLVEYLNSQTVLERWQERRQKEGRNIIFMTSQNGELESPPIMKNKEIVNPFTYAVARALERDADGFSLDRGKPVQVQSKNGRISVGELIDFVLYTTEHTESDSTMLRNIAKPQLAGSFNRDDVLFDGAD